MMMMIITAMIRIRSRMIRMRGTTMAAVFPVFAEDSSGPFVDGSLVALIDPADHVWRNKTVIIKEPCRRYSIHV